MLRISGDRVRPADHPQLLVLSESCAPLTGEVQASQPPCPSAYTGRGETGGACGSSGKQRSGMTIAPWLRRESPRQRTARCPRAGLTAPRLARLRGRIVRIRIAAGQHAGDDPSAKSRRLFPRRTVSPARRLPAPERLQLRDRHRPPGAVAMARAPGLHRPYRVQTTQRRELARAHRVLQNAHRNPTTTPIPAAARGAITSRGSPARATSVPRDRCVPAAVERRRCEGRRHARD